MTHFFNRYTLKDYLEKLPAEVVLNRFSSDSRETRKILSSRMMAEMIEAATSVDSVKERYEKLSTSAQSILLLTYLCGSGGIKISLSKDVKAELLNSFLIYLMVDDDSCEYLYGFSDIDEILSDNFQDDYTQYFGIESDTAPQPFFKYRALNDLVSLLNLASREELKLKKNGEPTLSTNSELKKITHISVDTIHFGKKSIILSYISKFLLHFAFEQGLIYRQDNMFLVSYKHASDWISKNVDEINDTLLRSALDYCGRWNIDILTSLTNNEKHYDFLKGNVEDISDALQLLYYCGFIGACKSSKHLSVCAVEKLWDIDPEDTAGSILILPDFSVMISQTISPELLYEFSRIGKLLKLDKVYKGKIDKEALSDSLSNGLKGEVVIAFLEKWRAPSNIIMSVKEWINEFHRVSIDEGKFIFISDNETVAAIGEHPQLEEYIEEVKTISVFRIKPGYESRVMSTLDSFGFDIRNQNIKEPDSKEPTPLLPRAERHFKDLKLVSDFISPAIEDADSGFVGGGKYSNTLKELSHHELMQVIDYALLMDSDLVIDYKGSEGVRKGMYTGEPQKITGPNGSLLEITESDSNKRIVLIIDQISRIAVSD